MAEQQPSSSSSSAAEQGICVPFDEAIATLPEFLQPVDEQERHELEMFLSQVDQLHKPVAGKISASSVFNFLDRMLKSPTPTTKGPSEVTFPEQLQELTENIAFQIVRSAIIDFDLHNTVMSVLNVMQEVSWEAKATLMVTTFVLTFGDKGVCLFEDSKVLVNEIQLFAKIKGGSNKQQFQGNKHLFTILFQLIGIIVQLETLSTKYMTSKDPKVKIERTRLIIVVYWIIRIIVVATTSHIIMLSSSRSEFDNAILALSRPLPRCYKILEDLDYEDYLKKTQLRLEELLKEDVDISAYNKIKGIVEHKNHSDNLEVLSALIPTSGEDTPSLYDCCRERKVNLDELKGESVLLFITGLVNFTPKVEETKLNEFIKSIDLESENLLKCNIVWMPIIEVDDHSQPLKEAMGTPIMLKPFLNWYFLVHHTKLLKDENGEKRNFKGLYCTGDPSRISSEVKKLIRDDWKYKKGEPMIVVFDSQGNIVHQNAMYMFYNWGVKAFPFTSKHDKDLCEECGLSSWRYFWALLTHGWNDIFDDWEDKVDSIFLYGGESLEWMRSVTGMVREAARELGEKIKMVYVGRSHNQELIKSVEEESLSHCLSDPLFLWMFWTRIHAMVYSFTCTATFLRLDRRYFSELRVLQRLVDYDKSNVGWALHYHSSYLKFYHGKVVLSTLKEFQLWKETAASSSPMNNFFWGFDDQYKKLYKEMHPPPPERREFPAAALNLEASPIIDPDTDECKCPHCKSEMEKYTTFVCYHPPSSN